MVKSKTLLILLFPLLFSSQVKSNSIEDDKPIVFYYLGDILDDYFYYYLKPPKTWNELETYADAVYNADPNGLIYYNILQEHTFPLLRQYQDSLFFEETECQFNLWRKEQQDSILIYNSDIKPCCVLTHFPYQEERLMILHRLVYSIPRAFDENNTVIIATNEESENYQNRMRNITRKYAIDIVRDNALLIEYKNGEYADYCNCHDIDMNSDYMSEIKQLIEFFCQEHDICRLLFYVYKERIKQ